jgi:hypothetical protein
MGGISKRGDGYFDPLIKITRLTSFTTTKAAASGSSD